MSKPLAVNLALAGTLLNNATVGVTGQPGGGSPIVEIGISNGSTSITPIGPPGVIGNNLINGFTQIPVVQYLFNGAASYDSIREPVIFKLVQAVSITAGTPVAVWTPAAGKKFRMMGYILATTVAASILFEDATGGANEFWRSPLHQAAVPVSSPPNLGNGKLSSTANNQLFLDVTVTGVVSGVIFGTEE